MGLSIRDARLPESVTAEVEISVVMPCLNEADTIGVCIKKALVALSQNGISGEVIVADNGSTDGSIAIAHTLGARVVPVSARGYGSALMGGISAARGRYILMGDADDSYDFGELPKFLAKLRQGHALVQGCRLPRGGGTIAKGAMPFLHRWVGNPALSWLARLFFGTATTDIYCGMRGFSREHFARLGLQCTGMEFATEMIVKSATLGIAIQEVPITLHPDGRKAHGAHLRTFRDGWRTLRFFLLFSPRWLFLYPGALLFSFGTGLALLGLTHFKLGAAVFDLHSLMVGSLAVVLGVQFFASFVIARTMSSTKFRLPEDPLLTRFFRIAKLEHGCGLGLALILAGISFIATVAYQWQQSGFSRLEYTVYSPKVLLGSLFSTVGVQIMMCSFLVSALGIGNEAEKK